MQQANLPVEQAKHSVGGDRLGEGKVMHKRIYYGFIIAIALGCGTAFAAELPATAKKASMEEFKALADGKPVSVEIFDAGAPITAELVWNWKKKKITGKAKANGNKIKVNVKLSFDGDKACSAGKGEKPSCHSIFIDGNKFYEVKDDMTVHAVSTVH
jgi:hypothetical protein